MASDYFPRETEGLPEARSPESFELADGDRFELRIAPIVKTLGEATVRMLAYNGIRARPNTPDPTGVRALFGVISIFITRQSSGREVEYVDEPSCPRAV